MENVWAAYDRMLVWDKESACSNPCSTMKVMGWLWANHSQPIWESHLPGLLNRRGKPWMVSWALSRNSNVSSKIDLDVLTHWFMSVKPIGQSNRACGCLTVSGFPAWNRLSGSISIWCQGFRNCLDCLGWWRERRLGHGECDPAGPSWTSPRLLILLLMVSFWSTCLILCLGHLVFDWFYSFLFVRSQKVMLANCAPPCGHWLRGAASFHLVPLLFNTYVKPLAEVMRGLGCGATNMLVRQYSTSQSHPTPRRLWKPWTWIWRWWCEGWMQINKLRLDTDKTAILLVGSSSVLGSGQTVMLKKRLHSL